MREVKQRVGQGRLHPGTRRYVGQREAGRGDFPVERTDTQTDEMPLGGKCDREDGATGDHGKKAE
jgi:hypothetical protein